MIKKILAFILSISIVLSVHTFAFAKASETETTKYPFVLVHGMMGWGENTEWQKDNVYWGMNSEKPVAEILRDKGYEVAVVTVAPMGSAWDRACELFAQLTGTVVDYGKAHSEAHNHNRYGRDYTDRALLGKNGWDMKTPVNLVTHSFGGPTGYVFTSMLEYGVKEEIEASPENCSELFKGGHKGLVYSMTTLESPHNGTPFADVMNKGILPYIFATFMNILGTQKSPAVDFMFDQFGITKDPATGGKASFNLKNCFNLIASNDHAGYDMTIKGSKELYEKFNQAKGTYYFSVAANMTEKNQFGITLPESTENKNVLNYTSAIVSALSYLPIDGKILGSEWAANDGLVPVVSALYPFGQEHEDYRKEMSVDKGVWYSLPVVNGERHGYGISGSANVLEEIWDEIIYRVEKTNG